MKIVSYLLLIIGIVLVYVCLWWFTTGKANYERKVGINAIVSLGTKLANEEIQRRNVRYYWTGEWMDVTPEIKRIVEAELNLRIVFGHAEIPEEHLWKDAHNVVIDKWLVDNTGLDFFQNYGKITKGFGSNQSVKSSP